MFTEDQLHRFCDYLQRFVVWGDEDAYEPLGQMLNAARDALRRIAVQRGIPDSDADDVVQDALRRAVARDSLHALWERHGEAADAGAYLRMELRGAISDYRKKRTLPADSLEQLWEGGRDIVVSPQPPPLDPTERQTLWQTIRDCLGNEVDTQILWLRVDGGLDSKQVAEMLCMSHENVRQRFCYAIEKLLYHEAFCRVCQQLKLLEGGE